MDKEQANGEINQFEGFQIENLCFISNKYMGDKMENLVTFSYCFAYITLFESFQTMPVGSCEE